MHITTPELLELPTGIGQIVTVPAGRVMLFDDVDLYQPIYGPVRKVETVEVTGRDGGTYIRTRITNADGNEWTCDSRTAVRVTRRAVR